MDERSRADKLRAMARQTTSPLEAEIARAMLSGMEPSYTLRDVAAAIRRSQRRFSGGKA